VPYDNQGAWLSPDGVRSNICDCTGCREYARLHGGQSPSAEFLSTLTEPVYNLEGYDQYGFDAEGLDQDGWDRNGYDREGFNREGFNSRGYDRGGFDREGFTRHGYDHEGYDRSGFTLDGWNREGYDWDGYGRDGYNEDGWARDGFNLEGFDYRGFDREGYDSEGFGRDGYNRQGLDRYGNERPCDCYPCMVDRDEAPALVRVTVDDVEEDPDREDGYYDEASWLMNYSFTPSPLIFRRNHGEDKDKTPYFGMEIEMTSDCTGQENYLGNKIGLENRLLYFKSDGSVDGFEMVTHPMTAKWAQANFPWDVVEVMAEAGASVNRNENGLHIHVSRAGFKDEAHLYRWLKFWYRNQEPIINIAGRDGAHWGTFDEDQREIHGSHLKAHAKIRHNPAKARPLRSSECGPRYCAINLQNEKTVEVRIFASTTSAAMLRTRFELVAASVEYTRDLPVGKIMKGGWKWDSFMLWLDENADEYSRLAAYETNNILEAIRHRNEAHEPALTLA
jgi:hypothetical protein